MGVPSRVRVARENGDFETLKRMQEKALRTRARNRERVQQEQARQAAETESAEEWYREYRERNFWRNPAVARQDHLLPEEDF